MAITPLYLSFADVSDLDPEVTEQVLGAVLRTMSPRQRAGYPGRLSAFAEAHHAHLERVYAEYGPGSPIAIHGRYSLVHSPPAWPSSSGWRRRRRRCTRSGTPRSSRRRGWTA